VQDTPAPISNLANRGVKTMKKRSPAYWFMLPAIVLSIIVMLYPLVWSFYLSLTNYYFLDEESTQFIGLRNYFDLFQDPTFLLAFRNSMLFVALYVPSMVVLSTIVAVLLDSIIIGVKTYRTLIFVPVCIGLTMATLMWVWMFADDGIVEVIMTKLLHLPPIEWLATDTSTVVTAVIITIWKFLGFNVVLVLAGLYAIPKDLKDAALIDGAGPWKRFTNVTLPLIKDSLALVIIMSTISSVKAFEQIWAVSRSGGTVDILYTLMYKTSFRYFEMGRGAAIAYIMAVMILVVSYINIRFVRTEV